MVDTIILSQPRGGGEVIEELPAEIISYGYRLNRPGALEFNLTLDHFKTRRSNLEEGVHEILIRRNGMDVWVGPLLTIDEDDSETSRTLNGGGEGLMAHFRKAYVTSTLTFSVSTDDQFDIARALIEHHQNKAGGDFGVDTSATNTSGRKRDRTYYFYEHKNIYEALVQLSEVDDGFDFEFNPATRAFDLYYPKKGQRRSDIVFDERNIRKFRRSRSAADQGSQVIGIGGGEGEDMLTNIQQSSTGVAKYGLTQQVVTFKDVTIAQTLQDHVKAALDAYADVPNVISIQVSTRDPQLFSYNVGDEVKVRWPSPYDPINEFQRLIGFDVVWTEGEETAVLHLEPL